MAKGKFVNGKSFGSCVLACSCKSEFQDKMYGKGMRLHSNTDKGKRCTVCGKDKLV